MNILVTGANGQLGNEMRLIASQLTTQNSQPKTHTPDLTFLFTDVCEASEEAKAMLRAIGGDNVDTSTTILDITNLEDISQLITQNSIHACVNCAAWTNVDGAEAPEKYDLVEKLNATAPENLAIAMKEVGGLLVHISTDYVFGKEPYNTPCKEDQKGTPTGVYGLTKLHGEQNIMKVMSNELWVMSEKDKQLTTHNSRLTTHNSQLTTHNGGAYVIIRTAWLYSEFGKNFCKTMLNLTATKPELKVVFDQVGTPTYALDLAKAITVILEDYKTHNSQLITQNYTHSGIYHFSNEGVCSWYDFTKMIQQIANTHNPELKTHNSNVLPCHSSEFPSPVTRPAYSVLDKTKIKETFGVEVPYWTESLRKCIGNLKSERTER